RALHGANLKQDKFMIDSHPTRLVPLLAAQDFRGGARMALRLVVGLRHGLGAGQGAVFLCGSHGNLLNGGSAVRTYMHTMHPYAIGNVHLLHSRFLPEAQATDSK